MTTKTYSYIHSSLLLSRSFAAMDGDKYICMDAIRKDCLTLFSFNSNPIFRNRKSDEIDLKEHLINKKKCQQYHPSNFHVCKIN
jgi:hypothetical protein